MTENSQALAANLGSVDPLLKHLGQFAGLVDKDGKFDEHWFSDPRDYLAEIPTNPSQRGAIVDLLSDAWPKERKCENHPVLDDTGKPKKSLQWLEVGHKDEKPKDGYPTALYVVSEKTDKQTDGHIGLGVGLTYRAKFQDVSLTETAKETLRKAVKAGTVKDAKAEAKKAAKDAAKKLVASQFVFQPFIYFPLVRLPKGTEGYFALGTESNPLTLGLDIHLKAGSQLEKLPFEGIRLISEFAFRPHAKTPSFQAFGRKSKTDDFTLIHAPDVLGFLNALLQLPDIQAWLELLPHLPELDLFALLQKLDFQLPDFDFPDLIPDFSMWLKELTKKLTELLEKLHIDFHFPEINFSWLLKALLSLKLPQLPYFDLSFDLEKEVGFRFQIKDKVLQGGKPKGIAKLKGQSKQRKVVLQLGETYGQENDKSWLKTGVKAGVAVHIGTIAVSDKSGATFTSNPSLELASVGLDIEGPANKPLFDVKGVRLSGVEPRFDLLVDKDGVQRWGVATKLHKIGIPLGPQAGGASGSKNPVAANLLGSGDSAKSKDDGNPTFSAVVAWTDGFYGEVISDIPSADGKAWIPVSRNFGPLHCRQIGLGFDNDSGQGPWLGIGYDGGVALGPLNIDLDHLTVDMPLNKPTAISDYKLGLAGLDVSYAGGPISISGGFLKAPRKDGPETQYDGMALIEAANFTITAFGSYTTVAHEPSLFIFAILHQELGGPPFFHVTGLAAGFGYNRGLKLPPIEEVHNFPLVRYALDDNAFGGADAENSIVGAMRELRDYIPASNGEYWFAAGIRFTSFEMLKSFVMLSVSFGHEVQIALLGLSRLTVPMDAEPANAVAFAELALKAAVKPEEGSITVEARLTDSSFVLSKACHLTGGFAFYTWLSGQHAGDFVVTLGGYHPKFQRPAHYPDVPRLKFDWQVAGPLQVTGEMYFALTPSCLMAGGKMKAVYNAGVIKAWYEAHTDFLLNWKPFYYLIDMGISLGVEADLGLFSIKVHVSVELHIWGPEFAGRIDVDLSVVSFSVSFGPDRKAPPPLEAQEFVKTFLPPIRADQPPASEKQVMLAEQTVRPPVITTHIASGLIRQETHQDKSVLRVVNGHALAMTTQSLIPTTEFDGELFQAAKKRVQQPSDIKKFGIQPMGKTELHSTFKVTLAATDGHDLHQHHNLNISPIETGVPKALWGASEKQGEVPLPSVPPPNEKLTIPATVGIRFSFDPIQPQHHVPPILIAKFKYEKIPKPIPWDDALDPAPPIRPDEKEKVLKESKVDGRLPLPLLATVDKEYVSQQRSAILDVLAYESPFKLNDVDLSHLANGRETYFQHHPEICRTGEEFT